MSQDNLITLVYYPNTTYYSKTIHDWLKDNPKTRFKYIVDQEAFLKNFSISKIKQLYPEIKVIVTGINPWSNIFNIHAEGKTNNSLDDFVLNLENTKLAKKNIVDYINAPKEQVDFILRSETIASDFQKISEYYDSADIPIYFEHKNFNHKHCFNATSQEIIKTLFQKDIEFFGY